MRPVLQLLLLCVTGLFTSVSPENVCNRPPPQDGSEIAGGQMFFQPGTEIFLTCSQGYKATGGSRRMVCKSNGEWTARELKCSPRRCPALDPPENGKVHFNNIVYQSIIRFSCDEGFVLHGNESSECLHTGQWSNPPPECKPVMCGLPDIPPFAKIVYDRAFKGSVVEYGFGGMYECLPPMVLVGEKRAICGSDGFWTRPPACRLVMCPVPSDIENGFLSFAEQREYGYKERVRYGCIKPFVLEGPMEVECEASGTWSRKPTCRQP
ncbi:beta-2-glycoprotein 1-like [Hoplias malabaricus]|uniref:beta-2-glycoprotein 1-like n=1 Tax=Hoplias malabaricus TaxID=27720 RepID=UPI003461F896